MKYELIKNKGKITHVKFIAEKDEKIFGDGIHKVLKDKDNHEYVHVPNPNPSSLGLFSDRIKDAAEQICNGVGDALLCSKNGNFLDGDDVVLFIDRNYGNLIKIKSRLGWKNTKFCYCIKGGFQYSFNSPREILKNGDLLSWLDPNGRKNIMTFDTVNDAEKKIKEYEKLANQKYKEYKENEDFEEKRKEIFNSVPHVIHLIWENNIDHSESWDNPGKFNIEVCQMIKEGDN